MNEVGILFTYYQNNRVVLDNFNSFKTYNPEALIIPISLTEVADLPNTYKVKHPRLFDRQSRWRNCDLAYYHFYKQNKQQCTRWLLTEWDTYCTCNISQFFRDYWNYDFVANNIHHKDSGWWWFRELDKIPIDLRQFVCGISPLTCTLLSDKAFCLISEKSPLLDLDIFCELRLATLAKICDIEITPFKIDTVTWEERDHINIEATKYKSSLWHPLKN